MRPLATLGPALLAALFATGLGPALRAGEEAPEPKVSIDVRDADVREVLSTLAQAASRNLIVSPGVSGRVTVRLEEVPFREALDAVLGVVGARAVEEAHGVLRVLPAAKVPAPEAPPPETPEPGVPAPAGAGAAGGASLELHDVADLEAAGVSDVPGLVSRSVPGVVATRVGPGLLLVRGTPDLQDKVGALLADLRRRAPGAGPAPEAADAGVPDLRALVAALLEEVRSLRAEVRRLREILEAR